MSDATINAAAIWQWMLSQLPGGRRTSWSIRLPVIRRRSRTEITMLARASGSHAWPHRCVRRQAHMCASVALPLECRSQPTTHLKRKQ